MLVIVETKQDIHLVVRDILLLQHSSCSCFTTTQRQSSSQEDPPPPYSEAITFQAAPLSETKV